MNRNLCLLLLFTLPLLGSCTITRGAAPQEPVKEKPVLVIPAVPVGKDWQVKERAPDLTDERGRLPFQTEESLKPAGTTVPPPPAGRPTIETPRQ